MLARLVSPFQEFGFFGGAVYAIDQTLARLPGNMRVFLYDLMVQPVPTEPLIKPRFMANMEFRLIEEGAPEVEQMPARADIKASRYAQDAICLGAYKKGELIGYIWLAFGHYDEDEVRARFLLPDDRSVFDFDLYIFEKYRFGPAFVQLWEGASRFLRDRGVHYSFSRLTRFNTASRRAHEHLGWKRAGAALVVKLWGLEIMFCDLKPRFRVSFNESGRAPIQLTAAVLEADGETGTPQGQQA